MAQHDYNIANQGFPAFRSDLNNALSAIQTTNSGTSRPTGAVAGQLWLDTTSPTTPTLKYYDGADDISLATIDHSANTVNWLDSTVSITGLSTTATGTVLTLSDSANTTTVNLILDNQKEIRFRETTANGTNYVALKAPASVSADLTFTLPATDGTNGQVLTTNGSGVLSFATPASGIAWQSSVKTSGFTAVAGEGYFCNTTSAGFTVTLPATPTAGQQVAVVDYAGTFDTNNLIISPNGGKIESGTTNFQLSGEREGVTLVYIDSTQGWLATSGINEGTDALSPESYSVDFLVVAGGGGASGNAGNNGAGGGGGAGGFRSSTQTVSVGTVITVTVGDGGTGSTGGTNQPTQGSSSSISGSGLTTITSAGGGYGGDASFSPSRDGGNGGSGGGAKAVFPPTSGGLGNTPSTSPSQGNNGGGNYDGTPNYGGGAGGGAGAVGGNGSSTTGGSGGNGSSSSITGSSVTYAGGGGAGTLFAGGTAGSGGTGGGGNGGTGGGNNNGSNGTVNLGGGGGGSSGSGSLGNSTGGSGGKGVVILSVPTARYSSTTTGSPTVTTSGANTIMQFNGSGSYTA
jgi:hypothetical protein